MDTESNADLAVRRVLAKLGTPMQHAPLQGPDHGATEHASRCGGWVITEEPAIREAYGTAVVTAMAVCKCGLMRNPMYLATRPMDLLKAMLSKEE